MRWFFMLFLCVAIHKTNADPDPKKYKSEPTTKDKKADKNLTEDEKIFLREVEEKFGIKSDIPQPVTVSESKNKTATDGQKPHFPAVIAIEIVNDTETNSKGKRTIDANLGYGYRTNNGYSYSYFGKPTQDKGKFMIYPYSQEDIPAAYNSHSNGYSSGKHSSNSHTSVEIQPSQAFELVEENSGYDYSPPAKTFETPAPHTKSSHPSTLYTTYNGEGFSGLSGQFPSLMSNYFVDPTQLIQNPQYQNVGLTQEHLRNRGSHLEQRVVPVLVLRVPSSYLKNPTAELYPNLPNNYPLSQHLNSVNLQKLVSQYFQKNGYPFSPQIMTYQTPVSTAQSPVVSSNYEPQHYANPYVQPAYTQADYSGVQYSAVKPVMAKYPLSYLQQKYMVSQSKSLYRQPMPQQQYEYQYQYVPSTAQPQQNYYVQSQEHESSQSAVPSPQYQSEQTAVEQQGGIQESVANVEYGAPQHQQVSQEAKVSSVEYETPQNVQEETHQAVPSYYETSDAQTSQYDHSQADSLAYSQQQASAPEYNSPSSEYYSPKQTSDKQTITVYPSQLIHSEKYQVPEQNEQQQYVYQGQNDGASHGFEVSENYPTKDHTIATVLPYTYKQPRQPSISGVQSVSYVTPMPTLKYQSQYRIMVPQTVLKNPNSEKVSYVNSHSLPAQYYQPSHYSQESSAEQSYSVGTKYVAPGAGKPIYSRHSSHPKRMAKPDNKPEASMTSSTVVRKEAEKSDKKKSA